MSAADVEVAGEFACRVTLRKSSPTAIKHQVFKLKAKRRRGGVAAALLVHVSARA